MDQMHSNDKGLLAWKCEKFFAMPYPLGSMASGVKHVLGVYTKVWTMIRNLSYTLEL